VSQSEPLTLSRHWRFGFMPDGFMRRRRRRLILAAILLHVGCESMRELQLRRQNVDAVRLVAASPREDCYAIYVFDCEHGQCLATASNQQATSPALSPSILLSTRSLSQQCIWFCDQSQTAVALLRLIEQRCGAVSRMMT
jgi:hypothetical protein